MSAEMSASTPRANQLFIGTFIHATSLTSLTYLHNAAVFVEGATGKIAAIENDLTRKDDVLARLGWSATDTLTVDTTSPASATGASKRFFFPGLVDTHIHAPQYPNAGLFGSATLLDWLMTYTFPLEASFAGGEGAGLPRARRVYARVVRRTLAHGTTAAAYFATTDVAATGALADACLAAGQRALVGRACMDEARTCPAWYRDAGAAASVAAAGAAAAAVRARDPRGALVRATVTPRFAPGCSRAALAGLGALARAQGLAVQTHVGETADECALVAARFAPETAGGRGYVGVYAAFGLLGPRTILAHAVHLSEQEAAAVAAAGAGVSHCPCSNVSLTSGLARVRWLLDRGVHVGLGTDVSGGYSASVLEAARQASLVSRCVAMGMEPGEERERAKLSVEEVLWLATRGGAKLVGLEGVVGGFEVGMEWDALLVELGGVGEDGEGDGEDRGNVDLFGWESWEECVAKWLFNGDDRNIGRVWVKGRLVHERA